VQLLALLPFIGCHTEIFGNIMTLFTVNFKIYVRCISFFVIV